MFKGFQGSLPPLDTMSRGTLVLSPSVRDHHLVRGHLYLSLEMKGPKLVTDIGSQLMTRCWRRSSGLRFNLDVLPTPVAQLRLFYLCSDGFTETKPVPSMYPYQDMWFCFSISCGRFLPFSGHAKTILTRPFNHLLYLPFTYRTKAFKFSIPPPRFIVLVWLAFICVWCLMWKPFGKHKIDVF